MTYSSLYPLDGRPLYASALSLVSDEVILHCSVECSKFDAAQHHGFSDIRFRRGDNRKLLSMLPRLPVMMIGLLRCCVCVQLVDLQSSMRQVYGHLVLISPRVTPSEVIALPPMLSAPDGRAAVISVGDFLLAYGDFHSVRRSVHSEKINRVDQGQGCCCHPWLCGQALGISNVKTSADKAKRCTLQVLRSRALDRCCSARLGGRRIK